MKRSYSIFLLTSIFFLMVIVSCATGDEQEEFSDFSLDVTHLEMGKEVLDLINNYREEIDLSRLSFDENEILELAISHSSYMIDENRISHDFFFDRSDQLREDGALAVSENVAFGYRTAEEVFQAWISSESHREAIEGDYNRTAIGILQNDIGVFFYTQIFAKY